MGLRQLRLHSYIASSLLILLTPITAPAGTLPPTDDILNGLGKELKAEVLSYISKNYDVKTQETVVCAMRVLEKDMNISFQKGTPPTDPLALPRDGRCSKEFPADRSVKISKISDLLPILEPDLDPDRYLQDWLLSDYGRCAYKRQLTQGLTDAAADLKKNARLTFLLGPELLANPGMTCVMKSSNFIASDTPGSNCKMAVGSSAEAVQCLTTKECRFDCGGGQHNIGMFGTLKLFAGPDKILSEAEKKSFDHHYPKVSIGKYSIGDAGKILQGLEYEDDSFSGVNVEKNQIDLSEEAELGGYGLTGYEVVIDTKLSYQDDFLKNNGADTKGATQLSSNGVLIETSTAGAKQFTESSLEGDVSTAEIVGDFERDMAKLTNLYMQLSFNENAGEGSPPASWAAFDQLKKEENRAAILKGDGKKVPGGYTLKCNPITSRAKCDADQVAYEKIQEILQKPIYRDTKLYIFRGHKHSTDIVTLADAILAKKATHPEAVLSFRSYQSPETVHFRHFIAHRLVACGK